MFISEATAIGWVEKLISLALILQTLEYLQLRAVTVRVWDWEIIRKDFETFPTTFRSALDFFLCSKNFLGILLFRLACAILIFAFPHPLLMFSLLISTVLISLRWRGTFNGGSDFMTLLILMALCVATLFGNSPKIVAGCLWYITLQTCTSYFISGVVKLKKRNWRTGRALSGFMSTTIYTPSTFQNFFIKYRILLLLSSWMVISFEILFPVCLLGPTLCLLFIGLAGVFHLFIFYTFGLNRFFFAWAAAYPALYFCSQIGSH